MDVLEMSDREALIIERRANRVPWRTIGQELGISHSRVIQIFKEARDRIPASRLADMRAESAELIDRAIADLLTIAEDDSLDNQGKYRVSARTRVEAWNAIRGFDESLRLLFGANAPARKEITILTNEVIDAAIEKLKADDVWDAEVVDAPALEA